MNLFARLGLVRRSELADTEARLDKRLKAIEGGHKLYGFADTVVSHCERTIEDRVDLVAQEARKAIAAIHDGLAERVEEAYRQGARDGYGLGYADGVVKEHKT